MTTMFPDRIKAIFFDIDGTLVTFKDSRMPESTRLALKRVQEHGIRVFTCSGRPPKHAWMMDDIREYPFDGYVLLNGQYCTDEKRNAFSRTPLTGDQVKAISAWLDAHPDVDAYFMEENYVYCNFHKKPDETYPPVEDAHRCLTRTTYQITPMVPPEFDEELSRLFEGVKPARWAEAGADLIPAAGGKAVGMQKMLDRFGFTREECIVFGDGLNDIDMFEYAGFGVAMGNAHPELKKAADYITDSIDENGVAKAIAALGL